VTKKCKKKKDFFLISPPHKIIIISFHILYQYLFSNTMIFSRFARTARPATRQLRMASTKSAARPAAINKATMAAGAGALGVAAFALDQQKNQGNKDFFYYFFCYYP
jgi:hypothetical protein